MRIDSLTAEKQTSSGTSPSTIAASPVAPAPSTTAFSISIVLLVKIDMRRANTIGADKYFHARGNYEAARRGTGGRHAATLISNAREYWQGGSGRGAEDSAADQEANRGKCEYQFHGGTIMRRKRGERIKR
ncbi:SAA-like protein [Mya arenaria]|uniref:SAA-like protein n=1 Tax=Mya arenaria TaxID=6604 RepID=A0ABY7FWB1_MYAAR|nr:SAA-like protein [Mya arenaria]